MNHALAILVSELRKIGQSSTARPDVDCADTPKRNATPSAEKIHDSLEGILKSAHAEYRKNRIGIRAEEKHEQKERRGPGAPKGHQAYQRIVPSKVGKVVGVKRRIKCPRHKVALNTTDKLAEHTVIDLAFSKNGCRKTVTKYVGAMSRCVLCKRDFFPPRIKAFGGWLFGHRLRAWAAYQRIALRLPYGTIAQVIEDLFNEQVNPSSVIAFTSDVCEYYTSAEKRLLKAFLPAHSFTLTKRGSVFGETIITFGC